MIESISLKNFRSHKDRSIQLDPHITVITGRNGVGKSNCLRALRWVTTNKPSGDSMRRRKGSKQADRAEVTLVVDGHTITRTKGSGRNDYTLDGKRVAVPKTGVPAPIAQLVSMDESNFSMHWRGPAFWFGLTAGQVAKELNRIVNLDKIDSALGNIAAKVRRCRSERSVAKDRLDSAKRRLAALAGVPQMVQDWQDIETQYTEMQRLREKSSRISDLLSEASRLKQSVQDSATGRQKAKALILAADEAIRTRTKRDRLAELLEQLIQLREDIDDGGRERDRLQKNLDRLCKGRCPLCRQPWTQKV